MRASSLSRRRRAKECRVESSKRRDEMGEGGGEEVRGGRGRGVGRGESARRER